MRLSNLLQMIHAVVEVAREVKLSLSDSILLWRFRAGRIVRADNSALPLTLQETKAQRKLLGLAAEPLTPEFRLAAPLSV